MNIRTHFAAAVRSWLLVEAAFLSFFDFSLPAGAFKEDVEKGEVVEEEEVGSRRSLRHFKQMLINWGHERLVDFRILWKK